MMQTGKPRALVCHPWMGLAGSEMVTAWVLQALSEDHDLTVCTAAGFAPETWNQVAGTHLDPSAIKWVKAPPIPGSAGKARLPHWHRGRFERFCREIAGGYDLLVSGYNPVHFGKPALHVVGDTSWFQQLDHVPGAGGGNSLKALLRETYRKLINAAYFKGLHHRFGKADWFLSNSRWTLSQYQQWAPRVRHELVYPPVPSQNGQSLLREVGEGAQTDAEFVTLGRISREKRLEDSIAILEGVRARGFPVRLTVIGASAGKGYAEELAALVADKPWVTLTGPLYGAEKEAVLDRAGYGIQACRVEAFGIAVAEMTLRGCLVWVPAESGSVEIVPDPQFQFSSVTEATDRICTALRAGTEQQNNWRQSSATFVKEQFSSENFIRRFRECLQGFS